MRVWQPGGHLMAERGARVDDWSWRRTRRRVAALARLTAPYKTRTILSVVSLLAATVTALAPPFLSKYAVDIGIREQNLQALWWIVGLFVLAGLANWGMSYLQTYLTGWVGERILADLRNKLFGHLQRLSLGYYERNRAGVIISRLTNDVEALDQLVTDGVTTLVQSTLFLIGTAVILFFLEWRLALATLIVMPFLFLATAFFRIYSARAYRAVRERLGLVTATLAEDISGMRVVQAFRRERANERNFRAVNEHYREANQQTVVLNGLYFPFV
ncbi:MAG: ABC transporter ATP-binding protein, partial [Gaiellaceae bacterium]